MVGGGGSVGTGDAIVTGKISTTNSTLVDEGLVIVVFRNLWVMNVFESGVETKGSGFAVSCVDFIIVVLRRV